MKQDEIIEMARQAGFETMLRKGKILGFDRDGDYTEEIEAFAKLVEAKEREACANLCEDQAQEYYSDGSKRAMNYQCADAIRARGEA